VPFFADFVFEIFEPAGLGCNGNFHVPTLYAFSTFITMGMSTHKNLAFRETLTVGQIDQTTKLTQQMIWSISLDFFFFVSIIIIIPACAETLSLAR
jgi:hypothetical protein